MRRAQLVSLLPPKARRTLACGEWYDDKQQQTQPAAADRSAYIHHCVLQLVAYGWTDPQIRDVFLSDMPLKAVAIFQEKYAGREAEELHRSLHKARAREDSHGNVLPRLLDRDWHLEGRTLVAVEAHPLTTPGLSASSNPRTNTNAMPPRTRV